VIAHVLVREGAVVTSIGDTADVPCWSFTKTVIATAALALVRDERLSLDETVSGRPYTLRQLLQHGAGLTGYGRLHAYHEAGGRNDDAWPADEMLAQAGLLLHRLLTGDLLPWDLLSAMCDRYPAGGPIAGRPWKTPGYGLGLMIGETTGGELIAGHTGGGPGSVVAVYHRLDRPTGTAAAFEAGGTDAVVEGICVNLLRPDS
jgi:CubicO group peptidase (beta-lactamase class C family)